MTIADLTRPDPLTLRFTPYGLSLAGKLRPEDSLAYLQSMVEDVELVPAVPSEIRVALDRLNQLHVCGLWNYGFFSVVVDSAWLLPEAALGLRFIEAHPDGVPFRRRGQFEVLRATRYDQVVRACRPKGRFATRKGWRLDGHEDYGSGRAFDASYQSLLEWARREGLLATWLDTRWMEIGERVRDAVKMGVRQSDYRLPTNWDNLDNDEREKWWTAWRGRAWERDQLGVLVELRNLIAHDALTRTTTPIDSALALRTVALLVNSLWTRT